MTLVVDYTLVLATPLPSGTTYPSICPCEALPPAWSRNSAMSLAPDDGSAVSTMQVEA